MRSRLAPLALSYHPSWDKQVASNEALPTNSVLQSRRGSIGTARVESDWMHGAARWSRYPSDSSRAARSGIGTLSAAESRACLVPPSLASYPDQSPIGARAMPASHDRMTTAVRSASGPPPVSHGRTTSHCSTGDRAKPASHSLRRQSGRPVVGRIAGPYRHCHAVGRTRAGHVHAGRIAYGVNSRGAALCASRPAPCGVSWASTRCRIASGARPRRHGDTGPSAATHHQPPSLGRPSPTLLPSAGARPFKLGAGAPVGPARAYHHSGRPSRPAHAIRQRRGGASARPPTHPATGPLTSARCARNVTRR